MDILAVNQNKSNEQSVLDAVKSGVNVALSGAPGAQVVIKNEGADDGMRALIKDACAILGISELEAESMSVGELNKRMRNYDKRTLEKLEDELEAKYEANKDVWGGLDDDALEDAIDEWKESLKEEEDELDDLMDDYLDWYEKVYLPDIAGITDEDDIERYTDKEEDCLKSLPRGELKEFLSSWAQGNPEPPDDDDDGDND